MVKMVTSQKQIDVKKLIFQDLKNVKKTIDVEAALLRIKKASNREIGRRLLFLFQCDLLPGISGKILELKGSRDNPKVLQKSRMIKLMGWSALLVLNLLMLFYILLFAFSQTGPRQTAWFTSFAIWLAMEIIIVSTSIVLISHIFIPMLIMKDLTQIKKKLIENIREYQDTIKQNKKNGIDCYDQQNDEQFNAAKYLFISTGLSKLFPDVKESKIIAQFSTPWPKQSYCRVKDVSKQYSKKFSALTRSASILIIFFAGQFLNMPSGFQDVIIHVSSTTAVGYIILLHIQLFQLFPALVILPACIIGIIVHFIITSGKADAKLRLAKLFPVRSNNNIKDRAISERGEEPIHDDPSSFSQAKGHQTRRASLQLGLGLIDDIQQIENSGSEESSSDSSDDTDDDDDDDDDEDDEDDCSDDEDDADDSSDDEDDDYNSSSDSSEEIYRDGDDCYSDNNSYDSINDVNNTISKNESYSYDSTNNDDNKRELDNHDISKIALVNDDSSVFDSISVDVSDSNRNEHYDMMNEIVEVDGDELSSVYDSNFDTYHYSSKTIVSSECCFNDQSKNYYTMCMNEDNENEDTCFVD